MPISPQRPSAARTDVSRSGSAARLAALAAAGFCLGLLIRLPAKWAAVLLPHTVHCQTLSGTLWHGRCDGLAVGGAPAGDLEFSLHPLELLTARLAADVVLRGPDIQARGRVTAGPGGVRARAVRIEGPLSHALLDAVPPGMHADIAADLAVLEWRGGRLRSVEGVIDVRRLIDGTGAALGDYRLSFPRAAGGDPRGSLRDLGGPLTVDATLTLGEGFVLAGTVAARPGAPQAVTDPLRYLGTPDAAGRRPFSVSGTF